MTTYYEVLRQVTPEDLDTHPRFVRVLKIIPQDGYVTFEAFKHIGKYRASHGIAHACSVGILKRVSPCERVLRQDSVKFWITQLNKPGHKNMTSFGGTRPLYLEAISKFDKWLPGRSFPLYRGARHDGQATTRGAKKSFETVEELMEYCSGSDFGANIAQRVAREYLVSPHVAEASTNAHAITRSAIKSYFGVHDIMLNLPKTRKSRSEPIRDDPPMTLEEFYKMLQNGKPGIMMRTAIMIKFQSAMDSSTFTDRFNHEGYAQIVQHFKTDDHAAWNLDRCPVPITVIRVKTDVQYTTFLDRDAITQLQEYLAWKEGKHGKHDASKPLFLTKQKTPIHPEWLSRGFSDVAVRAGIQKKVSRSVFKIRSHKVRHLLKSILLASGCAQYAADHVLGHAPRDTYEKQAILYPEALRAEYAKASSKINIFSKVESVLNSSKDPESQDARIQELEAQVRELTQTKAGEDLVGGKYKDAINGMNEKINRLLRLFDALPDDIKEKIPDDLDD